MKAFVFPGQGSQFVGMGKDFSLEFWQAREVFKEADEALSFPLSKLCFEGPIEELELTLNTQPAILTTSVAILRVLESLGERPEIVLGHSLGEYSATVCAGGIDFSDAVKVVRERGRLMQDAVPVGIGKMAAVLGLEDQVVREICTQVAGEETVSPATLNAPSQVVISGHALAVDRACKLAHEKGARKVVYLPVSAPFHCSLMKPAKDSLSENLNSIRFRDLDVPLINNVDALPITKAMEVKSSLIRQVTEAVQWNASVRKLGCLGVVSATEIGPGKVLKGLIRRIDRRIQVCSIGTISQVEQQYV